MDARFQCRPRRRAEVGCLVFSSDSRGRYFRLRTKPVSPIIIVAETVDLSYKRVIDRDKFAVKNSRTTVRGTDPTARADIALWAVWFHGTVLPKIKSEALLKNLHPALGHALASHEWRDGKGKDDRGYEISTHNGRSGASPAGRSRVAFARCLEHAVGARLGVRENTLFPVEPDQ